MRILHVVQSLDPADGGLPKAAVGLASAQADQGDAVAVISRTSLVQAAEAAKAFGWMPGFHALTRLDVVPGSGLEWAFSPQARLFLREWKPDVVHIHGVWLPLMRNLGEECRRLSIPYLLTFHGMFHPSFHTRKRWRKNILWNLLGWKNLILKAGMHIALNADEAECLRRLAFQVPVRIHPNGIFDEEAAESESPSPPARSRPWHGRPYILYLGRLHATKGVRLLLEAFVRAASRCDAHLVLAGPDGGLGAELRRRVRAAGLEERVHLPGPIYDAEKRHLLENASLFALTSPSEGFSVSILEAAAAGKAMVITTGCHFSSLGAAGAARIVPSDPGPVADALVEIFESEPLRARMGTAARELVRREFLWSVVVPRLKCDLQGILAQSAVSKG